MTLFRYLLTITVAITTAATSATVVPPITFDPATQVAINETTAYIDKNILALTPETVTSMLNELNYYVNIANINEQSILDALSHHCEKMAEANNTECSKITSNRRIGWLQTLPNLINENIPKIRSQIVTEVKDAYRIITETPAAQNKEILGLLLALKTTLLVGSSAILITGGLICFELERQKQYRQYELIAKQYDMIKNLLSKEKYVLSRVTGRTQIPALA